MRIPLNPHAMQHKKAYHIATWIFRPILQFAEDIGLSRESMCLYMEWEEQELFKQKMPVSYGVLDKALVYLLQKTNDPLIAVKLGLSKNMLSSHLLDYLVQSCNTVFESLQKIADYNKLLSDCLFLTKTDDASQCYIELPYESDWELMYPVSSRMISDCVNAFIYKLTERLSNKTLYPVTVYFSNPDFFEEPLLEKVQSLFQANVAYKTGANALSYLQHDVGTSLESSNPDLKETIELEMARLASVQQMNNTLSFKIKWQLKGMEKKLSEVSIDHIASLNNLSVRKMQQVLQKEGTHFRDIYNEVKVEAIKRYLENPFYQIKETAYILGYSSANALSAFFKKTTGKNPSEFSASLHSND